MAGCPSTQAVVIVTAGFPVETPLPTRLKFTSPGDAATEIESPKIAVRFTAAMLERIWALASGIQNATTASTQRTARPNNRARDLRCRGSTVSSEPQRFPDLNTKIRTLLLYLSNLAAEKLRNTRGGRLRPPRRASSSYDFVRVSASAELQRLRFDVQHAGVGARRQTKARGIDLQCQ